MKIKAILAAAAISLMALSACSNKEKSDDTATTTTEQQPTVPVREALKSDKGLPVVVDFFATWCGPCNQFRPTFHDAEKKYAGKVDFRVVDVDKDTALAQECAIEAMPTILFLDAEGREVGRFVGLMSAEQFNQAIDELIGETPKEGDK